MDDEQRQQIRTNLNLLAQMRPGERYQILSDIAEQAGLCITIRLIGRLGGLEENVDIRSIEEMELSPAE